MEISSNIIAVGATEREGMVLFVDRSGIEDSSTKCICFNRSTKEVSAIVSVAKATTFNAFEPLDEVKGDAVKVAVERELTDEQIYNINTYLKDER